MKVKETLRDIIREEVQNILKEDAKSDIMTKLQRMPIWKKYGMTFDIPGAVRPNKMVVGTTKDGRKTYSIAIAVTKAPKMDWQQLKSVALIQKYFPEFEVIGKHGTLGGVEGMGAGDRTYTFVTKA